MDEASGICVAAPNSVNDLDVVTAVSDECIICVRDRRPLVSEDERSPRRVIVTILKPNRSASFLATSS
jgi:hypothetical protein